MDRLKTMQEHTTEDIQNTIQYLKDHPAVSKYHQKPLFTGLIKQFEDELKRRGVK